MNGWTSKKKQTFDLLLKFFYSEFFADFSMPVYLVNVSYSSSIIADSLFKLALKVC